VFDAHVYDMIELGITKYEGIAEFSGSKKALGSLPCMVFAGEEWEHSPDHKLLRQMFLGSSGIGCTARAPILAPPPPGGRRRNAHT